MIRFLEFASKPAVLVFTGIATAVLLLLVFPNLPIGGPSLDTQQSYDFARATDLMELYGDDGRRIYAISALSLDTLLPLMYALCFSGLIYRFRPRDVLKWCALLPVLGALVDLGENAQIAALLIQFPEVTEAQVARASTFTQMKGLLSLLSVLLAIVFGSLAAVRWRLAKRKPQ